MTQVLPGNTTALGVRTAFENAWRQAVAQAKHLDKVMRLGLPSDGLSELYAWFKTAPYPERWERGKTIPTAAFAAQDLSITNYDFGKRIEWHKNDRLDDRTNGLLTQAQMLGQHWGTLYERFFFECLTATADLLPAIPNAPDGAAMHNATDGAGAERFGLSGGNVIASGSGVASGAAIRADYWAARSRMARFQDTEGQPLWDESVLDAGFVIVYAAENEEAFREAFLQGRTADGNAGVDNTALFANIPTHLWSTQRLSGNDWYVFATGSVQKAVVEQRRQDIETETTTMATDQISQKTKMEGVQFDSRHGVGLFLPYQTVKVNN